MSDPVHQVVYNPATGRNDVYFGPEGQKPGHAVMQEHSIEYLRGAGNPPPPATINTGVSVPKN